MDRPMWRNSTAAWSENGWTFVGTVDNIDFWHAGHCQSVGLQWGSRWGGPTDGCALDQWDMRHAKLPKVPDEKQALVRATIKMLGLLP